MRNPEPEEDDVIASVTPPSEEVGEDESYSGVVANPSPGELEHLGREVDRGNRIGVAKQLHRPGSSAASELEDVTGGPERIKRCRNFIFAWER